MNPLPSLVFQSVIKMRHMERYIDFDFQSTRGHVRLFSLTKNKVGYMAILVASEWAGALIVKVTGAFGQEH